MRVTQQHKPLSPVGDHLEGTAGGHRPGPQGGARSAWSTDLCLGCQSSPGCSDTSGRRSAWSRCLPRQSRAQGSEIQVSLCALAAPPSRGAHPGLSHEGRSFVNTREAETEIKSSFDIGKLAWVLKTTHALFAHHVTGVVLHGPVSAVSLVPPAGP